MEALPKPPDTFSTHVGVTNDILLQTAISPVSHSLSASCLTTRILFDSDSQRSYITQSLREKLGLETVRKELLILRTFGSSESFVKRLDVVKLRVEYGPDEKSLCVEVLSVPFICSPLSNQKVSVACEKFPVLKDLQLAIMTMIFLSSMLETLLGLTIIILFSLVMSSRQMEALLLMRPSSVGF